MSIAKGLGHLVLAAGQIAYRCSGGGNTGTSYSAGQNLKKAIAEFKGEAVSDKPNINWEIIDFGLGYIGCTQVFWLGSDRNQKFTVCGVEYTGWSTMELYYPTARKFIPELKPNFPKCDRVTFGFDAYGRPIVKCVKTFPCKDENDRQYHREKRLYFFTVEDKIHFLYVEKGAKVNKMFVAVDINCYDNQTRQLLKDAQLPV